MCRARGRLTKTSQIRFELRVECWLAFFDGHKVRKSCPKKDEILRVPAVSAEALHAARTEATKQAYTKMCAGDLYLGGGSKVRA